MVDKNGVALFVGCTVILPNKQEARVTHLFPATGNVIAQDDVQTFRFPGKKCEVKE